MTGRVSYLIRGGEPPVGPVGALGALVAAIVVAASGAAPAAAQAVAAHIAAGDAARCGAATAAAVSEYRAALAIDTTSYEANWKGARALVDAGKTATEAARRDSAYAAARALAERAVAINDAGPDGHYMLAVALGRVALTMGPKDRVRYAGRVRDEAVRALDLDPRHDGALHVLGRWNAEIERLPMMARVFARTFLGASVFAKASWDNAVRYFGDAVAVDPRNIYHRLDLAEALIDAGRAAEARPHLDQVAQLPLGCDPMDAEYKKAAVELARRIP